MLPVEPSTEKTSSGPYVLPLSVSVLASSSTTISEQPVTQHLPIPRATTAACDVIPPRIVIIPSEATIPTISSGEVSARTKITFSPFECLSSASLAENANLPVPAPGPAGNPLVIGLCFAKSSLSKFGSNNLSNETGSILKTASSSLINPSSTMSQAIFNAAAGVLLPLRVCKKYNLPSSTVNSISCISR